MNMHKSLVAVLGLILISSTASAATCRAGSAAQAGSNTGYERARAAADAWSQREN
ncbi:conjugal transfer protein, partial [Klebsiella pneumoniae]